MTEAVSRIFDTVVAPIIVWAATGFIGLSVMAVGFVVRLGTRVKRLEDQHAAIQAWLERVEGKLDQALLNRQV